MSRWIVCAVLLLACHRSAYDKPKPPSSTTPAETGSAAAAPAPPRPNETIVATAPARTTDITTPVRVILPDLTNATLQSALISLPADAQPIDVELALDGNGVSTKQTIKLSAKAQPLKFKGVQLKPGTYTLVVRAPGAAEQSITFTVVEPQLLGVYASHPPPRVAGAYRLTSWSLVKSPWGKKPSVQVDRATWRAGNREILVDVARATGRDQADMAAALGPKDLVIAGQTVRLDQTATRFEASWIAESQMVRVMGAQMDNDAQLVIARYIRNFRPSAR